MFLAQNISFQYKTRTIILFLVTDDFCIKLLCKEKTKYDKVDKSLTKV